MINWYLIDKAKLVDNFSSQQFIFENIWNIYFNVINLKSRLVSLVKFSF